MRLPPAWSRINSTLIRTPPTARTHRPFHTTTTMATPIGTPTPTPTAAVPPELLQVEAAKRKAAYKAVEDHFDSSFRFVGIGSGSTIVYGVEAIASHLKSHPPPPGHLNWFVPTGWNSRKVIEAAGLTPIAFDSLPADVLLDVAFDGADEVDADLNCIKGGGACLFQEKLVARRARKFVCIADYRKDQEKLLTVWPTIPIEVAPIAHASVIRELKLLGSPAPVVREHTLAKTGPVQTDQSFYIVDAPFPQLQNSKEVDELASHIKAIEGVLEVGLFHGKNGIQTLRDGGQQGGQKPVAVYFGLQNGEVLVRKSKEWEEEEKRAAEAREKEA